MSHWPLLPRYPGSSLEKEMVTHSSILAWKVPWTEEPSRPQSMKLQRARHDLAEQPLGRGSALSRLGAELELRRSGTLPLATRMET